MNPILNQHRELFTSEHCDPVVSYLYHRDILNANSDDSTMLALKENLFHSNWVQKALADQWEDGSWGRFHSLSSSEKSEFTTERAIRRLLYLGLDVKDESIGKALNYMTSFMNDEIELRDRVEKKHDWKLVTRLFVTNWILQIDPNNTEANKEADRWADVVSAGFSGDTFCKNDYEKKYLELHNPEPGKSFWSIQNYYIVSILKNRLSKDIERKFLKHLLYDNKGIYYIYDGCLLEPPNEFQSKKASRFLYAHELLSEYSEYGEFNKPIQLWIHDTVGEDGLWDFGAKSKDKLLMPLSENWKSMQKRKLDSTLRVLRYLKQST